MYEVCVCVCMKCMNVCVCVCVVRAREHRMYVCYHVLLPCSHLIFSAQPTHILTKPEMVGWLLSALAGRLDEPPDMGRQAGCTALRSVLTMAA